MAMVDELEALEADYENRASPGKERGTVSLIVQRIGGGEHKLPSSGQITTEEGLIGDRWDAEKDPARGAQLTLIMRGVSETVAAGKPLDLTGDNFIVDIDIGEDNAPVGTKFRIGSAVVEISEDPHTGCAKFSARLGSAALRWVNAPANRRRRLRGVNCRVLESGAVAIGDSIELARG